MFSPNFLAWLSLALVVAAGTGCNSNPSMNRPLADTSQLEDLLVSEPADSERMDTVSPDSERLELEAVAASLQPPESVQAFCGDCHALPPAAIFERDVWYEEIRKGYEFYAKSGRQDLSPPPLQQVLAYYHEHAPRRLEFPVPEPVDRQWVERFEVTKLNWKDNVYVTAGVSFVRWMELMEPGQSHLIVSDMRDGSISLVQPDPRQTSRRVIGRVGHPARVTDCDIDQDGWQDLVVADLGSFNPFDHTLGQVVWLRRLPETPDFEQIVLASGLPRVTDVSVHDFTRDGQLELLVAEFGHRRSGGVSMWVNESGQPSKPSYRRQPIDDRPGTVQLPIADWNEDGRQDAALLVSQEYEAIDLLINRPLAAGRMRWDHQPIWSAQNLGYGSVGLEVADLDSDGDLDLLLANGDCFDNNYANATHGIQWLENLGDTRFEMHRLADLPGAYRAVAGDFDNDGDQDIVAVANLPMSVKPIALRQQSLTSILLLEQTGTGQFETHVLERGTPRYPALEVADFNDDGKLDFAVGVQLFGNDPPESAAAQLPRLMIWWAR